MQIDQHEAKNDRDCAPAGHFRSHAKSNRTRLELPKPHDTGNTWLHMGISMVLPHPTRHHAWGLLHPRAAE